VWYKKNHGSLPGENRIPGNASRFDPDGEAFNANMGASEDVYAPVHGYDADDHSGGLGGGKPGPSSYESDLPQRHSPNPYGGSAYGGSTSYGGGYGAAHAEDDEAPGYGGGYGGSTLVGGSNPAGRNTSAVSALQPDEDTGYAGAQGGRVQFPHAPY
jgi:hypothetical protein